MFDGVGLAVFKSSANDFIGTIVLYYFSLSLLPVYRLVLWAGVFRLIGCISLSLSLALLTSFNNNIYISSFSLKRMESLFNELVPSAPNVLA